MYFKNRKTYRVNNESLQQGLSFVLQEGRGWTRKQGTQENWTPPAVPHSPYVFLSLLLPFRKKKKAWVAGGVLHK